MTRFLITFFASLLLCVSVIPSEVSAQTDEFGWKKLFDGKTLEGWSVPVYGGDGQVRVEDGCLVIGQGAMVTGIKYEKVFPRQDYEIRFQARRILGTDFFSSVTFPIENSFCTFINGGWGGGVVGLSCINQCDASENVSTAYYSFKDLSWYGFRLRVTAKKVMVWIEKETANGPKEELIIDVDVDEDNKLSLRSETSQYKPLGVCTWVSEGQIRNFCYRKLLPEEVDHPEKTDAEREKKFFDQYQTLFKP